MGSLLDHIKQRCGGVVGVSPYSIGEYWEYRLLTSKPSADPRTYGDWDAIHGISTQGAETQTYDEDRKVFKKYMNSSFRYQTGSLTKAVRIGDQVKDPEGLVWDIVGMLSSGPGTIALNIGREIALISGPDRKGGL